MKAIQKPIVDAAASIMLLALVGCTLIVAGMGAVAGSGGTAGMPGGALAGGVAGYETGK